MYTVVRFTSDTLPSGLLKRLGRALNSMVPAAFKGLRSAGDGFTCDIEDCGGWEKHHAAILGFINRSRPVIAMAVEEGVNVCVDVAIEPEDTQETVILSILVDPALARCLAEAGVSLELSFYV